ncbi:MAG: aminoglycoside phosphotransferase family protein [Anaerolineales bacterium]|jgi:spectinomycin phosphotransferase
MLEKPDLADDKIIACLIGEYGLCVSQIAFLPLGADQNTAVYRALTGDEASYFVKLRRGVFNEISVAYPKFLSDHGITQIIPPLTTRKGRLWADLGAFKLILYPYIEGHNAYAVDLSDRQWKYFGKALRSIHTAQIPPDLIECIHQETYSAQGRETVKIFLERIEHDAFDDPVAAKLAVFLKAKREEVLDLVRRAERLALVLQTGSLESIICHSDIHAGNILIDGNGNLYIIDWDDPILAPKERDLMSIGGGQFSPRRMPKEEEALFYQGYGPTQINPFALAYYRYERVIQDIAVYCEQLLLTYEGGEDREQSLRYLKSNFLPNGTIEIARNSDKVTRAR